MTDGKSAKLPNDWLRLINQNKDHSRQENLDSQSYTLPKVIMD